MVTRWKFYDGSTAEEYTFPINPKEGGTPNYEKVITEQATVAPWGKNLMFEGVDAPKKLEFSGTILTADHYNAMIYWWNKRRQIRITDDWGSVFWVYFVSFETTRVGAAQYPFKTTYRASCIILDW